jgi:hypothetical protein
MAIGIALLLGFHFAINFDSPYQSKNITEFWRRWHMSLSSWLKDYLYISLGGNRKGKLRTYFNLMLTMLLGGLWHGASFRFIIWGGLHGVGLAVHKLFTSIKIKSVNQHPALKSWISATSIFITFHFVCFCWIFFRAPTIDAAGQIIYQIIAQFNAQVFFEFVVGYKGVLFLMLLGYILHFLPATSEQKAETWVTQLPLAGKATLLIAIIVLGDPNKISQHSALYLFSILTILFDYLYPTLAGSFALHLNIIIINPRFYVALHPNHPDSYHFQKPEHPIGYKLLPCSVNEDADNFLPPYRITNLLFSGNSSGVITLGTFSSYTGN